MGKITEKEMEKVRKMIEAEFPDDPALQQVRIARKIIAREARLWVKYTPTLTRKHLNRDDP